MGPRQGRGFTVPPAQAPSTLPSGGPTSWEPGPALGLELSHTEEKLGGVGRALADGVHRAPGLHRHLAQQDWG